MSSGSVNPQPLTASNSNNGQRSPSSPPEVRRRIAVFAGSATTVCLSFIFLPQDVRSFWVAFTLMVWFVALPGVGKRAIATKVFGIDLFVVSQAMQVDAGDGFAMMVVLSVLLTGAAAVFIDALPWIHRGFNEGQSADRHGL